MKESAYCFYCAFLRHGTSVVIRQLTFTELELVKNGSLTGSVETYHKNTHFFLAELSLKEKNKIY